MTTGEKKLQEAIRKGDEDLAISLLEKMSQIDSTLTFEETKKMPKVFSIVENMMNNCLNSYVSGNNARGIRQVLIITNSVNENQKKLLLNCNGYLQEKIARQIFCEIGILDDVVIEILMNIPIRFLVNSIRLICEQWRANGVFVNSYSETLKKRVDILYLKRPELLCESLIEYQDFFSEDFQKKLISL